MCNIAGYIGNKRAAPVLIEMIKRQEGLNGGYYTGIATIHEGKIYYEKLTGDTDKLVKNTNALELPGNIGIIHSRTKSGGGDEWAHPFVTKKNGEVTMAYVANGGLGSFKERNDEYTKLTWELLNSGYPMDSRVVINNPRYQVFEDGSAVHMSDAMCQLIAKFYDENGDIENAMANAFCRMPSEIVGLLLHLSCPDKIVFSRINKPMFFAPCTHGIYLASSPTAFSDDLTNAPYLLPACTSGIVSKNGFTYTPFVNPPCKSEDITEEMIKNAKEEFSSLLKKGELSFGDLDACARRQFKSETFAPSAALCYQVLFDLKADGLLKERIVTVDGVNGNLAPKTMLSI